MKKNILFLQLYGGGIIPGGTEVYLKNLLKELSKLGKKKQLFVVCVNKKNNLFSPFVARAEDSPLTRFLENEKTLEWQLRIPPFGLLTYLWGIFWFYQVGQKLIKKYQIDLIYANGGRLVAKVAYLLHKKFGLPYILHFHALFEFDKLLNQPGFDLRKLLFKNITRNFLFNAQQIITNSEEVAEKVEKVKGLKKCLVVDCFTDRNTFYPQDKRACRKKLGLKPDDFVIVSTNRLEKAKRIHFLLKSIMSFSNPKVKVVFIGDGPLRKKIQKIARKDKRIIYLPPLSNEKLPFYLNSADFVWGSCSVRYFSLTLIEALACGVPIMASEIPISLDINVGKKVKPGTIPNSVGFLVKEEKDYMHKLLNKLIRNPEILEKKRKACLAYYQKHHGNKNIQKVLNLL